MVQRTFPWVRVQLHVVRKHFEKDAGARDLAWYDPVERSICVVKGALKESESTLIGVLRHELGHAADQRIDEPGSERRADRLSKRATGKAILYDERGLQNTKRGVAKRPGWLHQ